MASHEFLRSSREAKSLLSSNGHGGKAIDPTNIHHVPWLFSNLPLDSCSVCMTEVRHDDLGVSISIQDEINSEDDKSHDTTTHEEHNEPNDVNLMKLMSLPCIQVEKVLWLMLMTTNMKKPITGVVLDDDDNEDDNEEFVVVHTFEEMDNKSMKILSFPDMKEKCKNNLCCKICYKERHKGDILLYQKTYKLATMLTIVCKYGHEFHIHLEKIDENKSDSSENFKINILFILGMQLLGKGLQTMCIFLGLLGIRVSEGNYHI